MSAIALKFTSLLLRTIAKPIASTLKAQAKEHEMFKNACIKVAQTVHSTDIKLRMRLLGENKIKIRPLNDKKAVESGANFLSELFIFSVAGSLILYESNRSRVKANTEKLNTKNEISDLQGEIREMKSLVAQLTSNLELLHTIATEAATKTVTGTGKSLSKPAIDQTTLQEVKPANTSSNVPTQA